MPLAPPAVMVEPPPDPAPDADPIQRGVSLGLRARSPVGSSVSNAPSSSRKETYMWEGYRYEIDEDTQPEWIHASNKGRRGTKTLNMDGARSPSLASTTSSVPSTLIAQMIAATKLIVKLPVTVTEQTLSASRQLTSTGFEPSPSPPPADEDTPTPMDIDGDLSALSRFGLGPAVIEKITALTILEAPIELLLQPPYVVEPDLTTIIRIDDAFPVALKAAFVDLRKTVLRTFYGRNTFQCAFHTTITKFLRQMDTDCLKCLKPGSVQLTNKLAHMGFVHRALQDFNQRNSDGLLPDAVVVPITVKDEEQDLWVSWANVDEFDGLRGGWSAGDGKMSKIKPPARIHFDSDDDDLYT